MKLFRVIAALLILISQVCSPLFAADFYWDSDANDAGNQIDGAGLGGTGTWDTSALQWWPVPAGTDVVWPNTINDNAIFSGSFVVGAPTTNTVTVSSGINANRLTFHRSGYTLTGGDITLGGTNPSVYVNAGEVASIATQISGVGGLVKRGAGSVRLTNVLNDYTGVTSIQGGSIIISDPAALGGTGTVSITSGNNTPSNSQIVGMIGGSLVLDGTSAGMTFNRNIDFEGRGPLGDRNAAILSIGNNTLSGTLRSAISPLSPTTVRNSRINSVNGTLTISGTLNVGGTAATTFTNLGGINLAGVSNFNFGGTGTLTGSGSIEKSGQGTLFLNSLASNAGFSGTLRVGGSAVGGQSSVRVTNALVGANNVFGSNTGTNNLSTIDMRGGVLEFRNDGNMNIGKNVFQNNSSTYFTGPAAGGSGINGTTTLGGFRLASNTIPTFNSRNGFGMTFGTWTQESSGNNNTITNNMGGTLLFTGDAWNNADGSGRTLIFDGNGNTRIAGNITASGTNKAITKDGSGELILNGTAGTITGATTVAGGSVRITDFRSINNAVGAGAIRLGNNGVNGGTGGTGGNLIIGGIGVGTGTDVGLTTSKEILFNVTTGQSSIYANQGGTNPVILNGAITTIATGGNTANFNFGGSSTADNIINVAIPAGGTASGFTKVGSGTWVLNAANLYTGNTNIQNGTLKLRATGTSSNVINDTGAIVFSSQGTALTAGGTLEFRGDATGITTETLGTLTATAGAGTVRLLGQGGFAANLTFTLLGTTTAASSVNFDTTGANGGVITIIGQVATTATALPGNGGSQGHFYINGANFATTTAAGVVEAPTYGATGNFRNAGPALVASTHNRLTQATASGALTISSLVTNSQTLTLSGNLNVTTGGILQSGGTASIVSDSVTSRLIQGGTAGTNVVIRVDGASDVLNLGSLANPVNISSVTTAGLTKNGAGQLVIFGTNAQTGTTNINEGTVTLSGANSRLSATSSGLVIRQGAVLELNGHSNHQTAALDGAGTIRNVGPVQGLFQSTGAGTWMGTIEDGTGGGGLRVVRGGAGATWGGLNTYSGSTSFNSSASLTVDHMANGGVASGIGQSSNSASNLVFNGSSGLIYRGSIIDNALTLGSRSASTDRLFTLGASATTPTLSSTASNNNAIVWSNTGAIVNNTTADATLILTGTSTGDNTLNPQLVNSSAVGSFTLGLTKTDVGQWNLGNANNSYTGITRVENGILGLNHSGALPTNSALVLGASTTSGILQASGTIARNLSTTPTAGTGTITWGGTTGGGGFAAHAEALTVTLNGGGDLTWGSGGFVGTGGIQSLILNSSTALADVAFTNNIDLGAAARTVTVNDNINTGADYASLSGVLSGASGGIIKNGAGILRVGNANTYTGSTAVENGTLVVSSLGGTSGPASSSVGAGAVAMNDANAIVLGNATTTGGVLQYVGAGETSDRKIRIRGTTASNQIHADGSGSLVLTNVAHDTTETGNKTLFLRGTNTGHNMITSVLSNNGAGVLSLQVDGGASWILTGANGYTGGTTVSAGALGIGSNASVLGTGSLSNSNGNIFAYGADRTITNAVTLSNNSTNGWFGDYSLTLNGANNFLASDSNITTINSIAAGKTLTFQGVTANSLNGNRAWAIDGPGETVISGNFTTTQTFGVRFDVIGGGTLNLGTNGATSNWNQNSGISAVEVDRGTLKFSANNAIPTTATSTGVILSPELASGDTATIDLNGTTQTINALVATTDGAIAIDNTSATAAEFRFGANNTAANFNPTTTGSRTITDSGAGALSITKLGTTSTTFNTGMTLTYQGVTGVEGGSLTINSAVNGTSGLRVENTGSVLTLAGGITTPTAITSVNLGNGATLSLLDGSGNKLSQVSSLTLGSSGGTLTTLNLNVGDSLVAGDGLNTDTLTLSTGGSLNLFSGNQIRFNLSDSGLNANSTYVLLDASAIGGGFTSGPLSLSDYFLGSPIGGFTSADLSLSTNNQILLTTGNLITGASYFTGITDTTWNANANNWSSDKAGTIAATSVPGQGTDVVFRADNAITSSLTTTLESNFKINSLTFEASTNPGDTPATIVIAPGTVATNRLEIAPQNATDGIQISSGGTSSVTISAPVRLGADQTWNVADATANLTLSAGLQGEKSVTKTGAGKVTLNQVADPVSFNPGQTAEFIVDGGTLEIINVGALGSLAGNNRANISVNTGAAFYYNGTGSTVTNHLALDGGTLSAGTASQTYSGNVNVSGDSFINMRDSNSNTVSTTQRNITLSGVVSGSGSLTLDSINTPSNGNQFNGNFTLNNAGNTWDGDLVFNRGTAILTNAASPSFTANDVNFSTFGRLQLQGPNGSTLTRSGTLTFGAGAIGELSIDNTGAVVNANYTVDQVGAVTLGSVATGSTARLFLADAFSKLTISGDITLGGDSSISVGGDAAAVVTVDGVITDGSNSYRLAINDDAGSWATANRILRLNSANLYDGGTLLAEGTLQLGNKDALGSGTLTITGASTIQATTDLSGANAVANSTTLNNNLTVSGTNNLELSGTVTGTGGDADRTLTNNITGPTALTISGPVNLGAAANLAARTLTVAGTGATTISGTIINGNGFNNGLTKTGAGTLTLSGLNAIPANNYSGATTLNGGTTVITTGASLTGGLNIGTAGSTTTSILDLSNGSAAFAGPTVVQTNSTTANTVTIGSGQTLQFNGAVTIGTTGNTDTRLTATGLGTLSIGNVGTPTNLSVQLGGNITTNQSNGAVLDMSGLSNFYANLGTGNLRVGNTTNANGNATRSSSLILANDSTILATTLIADSPDSSQTQVIKLGSGTNTIAVNTIQIANNGRSSGSIDFNGVTGTLSIRSLADPVNGRATLNVANHTFGTAANVTGTFDTTGHSADLRFSAMNVASRSSGAGSATATFGFDTGTLDANGLTAGNKAAGSTGGNATGTVNLGGGTAVFNSATAPMVLGANAANNGIASGTLNISGTADVTVAANAGTAIQLGNATNAGGTATGEVSITGGSLTVGGNIVRGGTTGTSNATVTLNGGTLDVGGFNIGAVGAASVTLNAQSGTLEHLAELNGGGALTKSTGGTLTMQGNNTYTGATNVDAGVLAAGSSTAFGSNSAVTVASGATLRLAGNSNSIGSLAGAGDVDNATGAAATLTTGGNNASTLFSGTISNGAGGSALSLDKIGTGTMTVSGNNTYTGATNVNAGVLTAGSTTAFGTNSAVSVATAGTLRLNGNNISIGSLAGNGLVENTHANDVTLTVGGDNTTTTFTGLIQDGVGGGKLSLLKVGTGTLILTNTNTFTGANTVQGVQIAGSTQAFGVNSAVTVTGGLQLAGFNNSIGSLAGTGAVQNGSATAATLTTGGDNTSTLFSGTISDGAGGAFSMDKVGTGTMTVSGTNTYTGATNVNGGVLAAGSTTAFGTNSAVTVAATGTLTLAGNSNSIGSLAGAGHVDNATGAAATLTTGGNNASTLFSGTISNGAGGSALSLDKIGTGTMTVTGANTYTGTTTITAGSLIVNNTSGSGTGSGNVIVKDTATLGGTGTIAGATTFEGGATHAAGNSPGTQTFSGDLTYNSTGGMTVTTVEWELITNSNTAADYDRIVVGGVLDFANSTTLSLDFNEPAGVDWNDTFWASDRIGTNGWLVFDGGTGINNFGNLSLGGSLADSNNAMLNSIRTTAGFYLSQSGGDIYLNYVTAVPEPGTIGVLGLAGLALAVARRRKARKAKAQNDAIAGVDAL